MPTETSGGVTTESREDAWLELYVNQDEEGAVAAFTEVRWCISKSLIEEVQVRGFKKPYLLLAVRAHSSEEMGDYEVSTRVTTLVKLVPLTKELTFLNFRRPGLNEIRAVIVDIDNESSAERVRDFVRTPDAYELFDDAGKLHDNFVEGSQLKYIAVNTFLDVNVPLEMFAEPPTGWRKKLTERFYSGQSRDECQTRSKLIFGSIRAFFLLTIGQLYKLITTIIALWLGIRPLPLGELLHPWKGKANAPLGNAKSSIWFQDKRGESRPSPLWLINPIMFTVTPLVVYAIMQIRARGHNIGRPKGQSIMEHQLSYPGWWQTVLYVDLAIICLTVIITLFVFICVGIGAVVSNVTGSETHKQKKIRQQQEAEENAKSRAFAALEAMTCTTASSDASFTALPSRKRTIELRFNHLKKMVCRPYAR